MQMLRSWLRRWLGVEEVERKQYMLRGPVLIRDFVEALPLAATKEELRSTVELDSERHNAIRKQHEALVYRLDVVDGALKALREKVESGPEPVMDPIMCPNGHTGLVMAVALARFSAKDPSRSEVVGGGFSCSKCGQTFYADREGRWLPAEAAVPPGETPPAKAAVNNRLRVRSRRGGDDE
jgi:hypothetical protein